MEILVYHGELSLRTSWSIGRITHPRRRTPSNALNLGYICWAVAVLLSDAKAEMKFENPTLQRVKHQVANRLYKPEILASHRCCSRPASTRFQQTRISPAIAESHMANTRRSKLKPWKTKPIQATSDPQFALVRNPFFAIAECFGQPTRNQTQGPSPAPTPNIASTSARSTDIAMGKLERVKNLLPFSRSNQTIASASMSVGAFIQADLRPYSG